MSREFVSAFKLSKIQQVDFVCTWEESDENHDSVAQSSTQSTYDELESVVMKILTNQERFNKHVPKLLHIKCFSGCSPRRDDER